MSETLPARANILPGGSVAALVPQSIEEAFRLATAFAASGMAPKSLNTPEAILTSILAGAELGMKPFQSMQAFAVVNGRPTLWGDAVPALLWSNGFKIKEWMEGWDETYPNTCVAYCEVTRPDGEVIRGEFSVFDAKEARLWTKEGPWQTAKKRMMKMRARAFAARDGAPDVLRGLQIREEVDDYVHLTDVTPQKSGLAERLASNGTKAVEGFSAEFVDKETGEVTEPKRTRRTKAEMEAARAAEALGDNIPAEGGARPTETASAQSAEPEQDTSASAVDASDDFPGDRPSRQASSEPTGDGSKDIPDEERADEITAGYPSPGEIYHLDGDSWDAGRRETYKDGKPFSSAGRKAGLLIYEDHLPAGGTTEVEPETEDDAGLPPELDAYVKELEAAPTWVATKAVMQVFYKGAYFLALTDQQKNRVRGSTWDTIREGGLPDLPDHAADVSAFRLWIEWCDDPDAITGTLRILENEAVFKDKEPSFKDTIRRAVAGRLEHLEQEARA